MNRIIVLSLLVLLLPGCATAPPRGFEDSANDASAPHTVDDVSRRYSAPFETVVEACKLAFVDVGADSYEPKIEMDNDSATITGASKTRLYGVLLLGYDEYTDVMLFLEDKSTQDVIKKSVFDEFWTAVESHL